MIVVFIWLDSLTVDLQTTYESNLTTASSSFARECIESNYYYEAIQVNVVEDGNYILGSESEIDTVGYLYENQFNPLNPSTNRLNENDEGGCDNQFKLIHYLQKQITYILVVTTYEPNKLGSYSVIALGPNNVTLKQFSKYMFQFRNCLKKDGEHKTRL